MNRLNAAFGTALLLASCASTVVLSRPSAPLDRPRAPGSGEANPEPPAVRATQRLIDFLAHLSSTSDITLEHVGNQFGGKLAAEDGAFVYRSADLGGGWNYGVKVILPSKAFKTGFNFWLYNPDSKADPTSICALSLDALRKQLVAHGFTEKFDYSEIGSVDSVEFVKSDIVLTVLGADLLAAPNGNECFKAIQTLDGH